jgi:hypothetical protein
MYLVGQACFDIRYGRGIVVEIKKNTEYPVHVRFHKGEVNQYTLEGKDYIDDEKGLLQSFEYKIEQI